jgi:glycosyltransferase involved in cell wall biosynthesis
MSRQKILIFTSSHLCRNPRVVKEATTLGEAGYDVTVLTVSNHEQFEHLDQTLVAPLPFRRVTLDYTARAPRARLEKLFQRTFTWGARQMLRWLRIESPATLGPARALLHRALAMPADLVIAHTEIPLWASATLIRAGRMVAVDIEDWYSEDLLFADRRTRPLKLLRQAEKFALQNARYVSTTSQSMARALAAACDAPAPIVLLNVFPLQPHSRLERPAGDEPPSFVWFSQTIGPGRGLELFFAAWSRMTVPSRVFLLGDEFPGYRDKILNRLPPERRHSVSFIPFVPPESLPQKLAGFDLGLALEPSWPLNRDITISNKIFQYMNAGLAVVATDTAGQNEALRAAPDAGLLVAGNETGLLARQFDELLAKPARLRAMQAAARRAAEERFSWEHEAPLLLAAVKRAIIATPATSASPPAAG